MYILHTIWLPLFSTFTTIIALPLAQSDFNIFSSDSPGSSFTSSQASGDFDWVNNLYPNNNNEQPATELFADGKKDGCKSSSVDVQANIGKRQTETACPVQSKGSPRQLMPVPQFTSPRPITIPDSEPFLPPLPLQNPDDDKCPVELMGMSRIPVCDSGRTGQDIMRMPGFEYYTLFNIHPSMYCCIFLTDFEFTRALIISRRWHLVPVYRKRTAFLLRSYWISSKGSFNG